MILYEAEFQSKNINIWAKTDYRAITTDYMIMINLYLTIRCESNTEFTTLFEIISVFIIILLIVVMC